MSEAAAPSRDSALAVLLLEDSRFDAELLREALLAAWPRATLEVVASEDAFIAAAARGRFDLILSDYELPGFSGEQALEHARAVLPQVPFIFVSGVIGEDNAVEMLKRGATDYVSKGRLARLPVVVERALREAAERQARSRAEARLREANATFSRVVDTLRDYAVILMDPHGRIRSWNQAAQDIFGYVPAEAVGQSGELLFTPEDREAGAFASERLEALAEGRAKGDRWMLRRDGLRLWAEGVLTPLYGETGQHTGFCKVVHDATGAYRDAQALRAAKEQAERANQAKDHFLAVLSHELRTPLAPVSSAAHILEQVATVPERYRDLLPMIRRNVALEARLIDDLLDLTAIHAGKVSLQREPVDLHRLVRIVLQMLQEQIDERRVEVRLDLAAAQPLVLADEARMQQVLWNILRNALKFTAPGGHITLRSFNEEGRFKLTCADDGIGIDPAALGRIFTAFEQADAGVSQQFGGLGLGLAIARGLVMEHQGELSAASTGRGQGATFTLALPSHIAPRADDRVPREPEAAAAAPAGQRVLLVEDNIDAAESLSMCLEIYGYQVTHAATCAGALKEARKGAFDVVLTDLGLPDGSGIDIGRALSPALPVVALSGYGAAPDLQQSTLAGFAGHLVKPVDPVAVHATLQKVLADRAARLEAAA